MLRKDRNDAIERLWPGGLVEMNVDYEDSWFFDLQPELTRALQGLKGCSLPFEHEAKGEPVWWDESNPEEDPPDDAVRDRSYHLYFVAPTAPASNSPPSRKSLPTTVPKSYMVPVEPAGASPFPCSRPLP
jgi:hypothetical protein